MRPGPLPGTLGVVFSVSEARDAGVSPRRLRSRDLERPFHGVRARSGPPAADAVDAHLRAARALATVMPPSQFFSHATAAVLWGLPLPAGALRDPRPDVCVLGAGRTPRCAGVRGHRVATHLVTVCTHPGLGLRVTSPASTWASLATVVPDIRDLVAAGDAVIRVPMFRGDPPALATLEQLAAAAGAGRRHGVDRLRAALPLVRERSASRPETWCRLALVDAGLPEPALNWSVVVDGRVIACVDLAYPRERVAIEYEGGHHATDGRQWARDIERHEALAAAGWIVIRVTKEHLFTDAAAVVARVRRARTRP